MWSKTPYHIKQRHIWKKNFLVKGKFLSCKLVLFLIKFHNLIVGLRPYKMSIFYGYFIWTPFLVAASKSTFSGIMLHQWRQESSLMLRSSMSWVILWVSTDLASWLCFWDLKLTMFLGSNLAIYESYEVEAKYLSMYLFKVKLLNHVRKKFNFALAIATP